MDDRAPFPVPGLDLRGDVASQVGLEAVDDDARGLLTRIGQECSLRYAIHLIAAASLIAAKRGGRAVALADVSRAYDLFLDARRSAAVMVASPGEFLFNEVGGDGEATTEGEAAGGAMEG